MARTRSGPTFSLKTFRPDIPIPRRGPYRNPLIFARELHDEMLRDNLTRVQLGQQHGVTSDRITQWLCLLKLPEEKQREIEALGDRLGASSCDGEGTEKAAVVRIQTSESAASVTGDDT